MLAVIHSGNSPPHSIQSCDQPHCCPNAVLAQVWNFGGPESPYLAGRLSNCLVFHLGCHNESIKTRNVANYFLALKWKGNKSFYNLNSICFGFSTGLDSNFEGPIVLFLIWLLLVGRCWAVPVAGWPGIASSVCVLVGLPEDARPFALVCRL